MKEYHSGSASHVCIMIQSMHIIQAGVMIQAVQQSGVIKE